ELVLAALRLLAGPMVMIGARHTADADSVTAQEVINRLGNQIDLVVDDGRCKFAQRSSIVRVDDQGFHSVRQAVFTQANLKRLASFMVVLVCPGNPCRSPMAEMLLKQRIAKRLNCKIQDLDDRGIVIMSAGISAAPGGRAAAEAIQTLQERSLDLGHHE